MLGILIVPDAGIDRVAARVDTCLGDDGTKLIVILSTEGNVVIR